MRISHRMRIRLGQSLGLLFLIGPLADLLRSDDSVTQTVAILAVFAVFVALYLALLPPGAWLARRGARGSVAGLVMLALTAGLTLLLGAPGSFTALFVYVAVACGLLADLVGIIAAIFVAYLFFG